MYLIYLYNLICLKQCFVYTFAVKLIHFHAFLVFFILKFSKLGTCNLFKMLHLKLGS